MTKAIFERVMKILDDRIAEEEFVVNNTEWSINQINANAKMMMLKEIKIRMQEAIKYELSKQKPD